MLEANLRRVLSWKYGTDEVDGKELRTLSRAALRSYARYWLEVFRLPVTAAERLVGRDALPGPDEATLFANLAAGRGVIIALPHMGNWDAGRRLGHRPRRWPVHHRRRAAASPSRCYERFLALPRGPGHGGPAR